MTEDQTDAGTIRNLTPQEVADGLAAGTVLLVDVRTPAEYAFERVRGALLLPMQEFDAGFLPEDGEKTVVLHCGSGIRSRKMGEKVLGAGRDVASHMEGGFGAWKKAGLPYIGTEMSSGAPKEMRAET